ncbi:Thiamine transporter 2 [Frankliniella fusca]|uniref:Thiamine transporter 2 n=1 Tax=Frankliniella fusca TaxID=407009 RepID=A0AAE1HBX8_9NEOP|nr:Thiamine transporter 2 [Frankliniella fusca]
MEWKLVAALLAGYGFLKEIRPSEPYITQFLTGPDKGFSAEQVNQQIYPVSTYSMLALLIVIFLVTDYLRYKPVIVAQSVSAVATYCMLAWCRGLAVMQFMEVLYGLMWAADVAYFTYMYAKVSRSHYGTVSATARVGYLLGRCGSGVLSQVAVSFDLLSLLALQYVTLGASVAATVFALALPGVSTSFYFHKRTGDVGSPDVPDPEAKPAADADATVVQLLWSDCREAFTQMSVVKWSLWWALATAGQMMVLSYVQILWQAAADESGSSEKLWNGAVEAVYTLLGAGAVWLTTRKKDYSAVGDALVGVWSLAAGTIVTLAARSRSMAVQYVTYVAFATSYNAAITVAYSEVAKRVREDAHALVFGINTLGALLVQTLLTFTVAGEGGLELDIRTQFTIYGSYFIAIGLAFLVVFVVSQVRRRCRGVAQGYEDNK